MGGNEDSNARAGSHNRLEVEGESAVDDDTESDCDPEVDPTFEAWGKYWVSFNYGSFLTIEYQIDTVLEIARYCLIEPVALGFFPFIGGDSLRSEEIRECRLDSNGNGECRADEVGSCAVRSDSTDADVREVKKALSNETVELNRVSVQCLL